MRSNIIFVFTVLFLSLVSHDAMFAQKTKATTRTTKERETSARTSKSKGKTIKRKGANDYWMIGIGGNVVDDDGNPYKKLFNAGPRWNLRPYPTRISVEKSIQHTFSIETVFNFNQYKPSKIINNEVGKSGIFLSLDVNLKNDFNQMINKEGWFNPYVVYGLGGTFRTVRSLPIGGNLNLGFGFNIWLTKSVGVNFQSVAKYGVSRRFPRSSSNYLQHSTGIVVKIQKGKPSFYKRRYKWINRRNIGNERS